MKYEEPLRGEDASPVSVRRSHNRWWNLVSYCRKAVVDFPIESDSERDRVDDDRGWDERVEKDVKTLAEANAISSEYVTLLPGKHMLFLDLDRSHSYMPSSTPGHGHLVIDAGLTHEQMMEIYDVLVKYNIIQWGFAEAAKQRGAAWLRLPWGKKSTW